MSLGHRVAALQKLVTRESGRARDREEGREGGTQDKRGRRRDRTHLAWTFLLVLRRSAEYLIPRKCSGYYCALG